MDTTAFAVLLLVTVDPVFSLISPTLRAYDPVTQGCFPGPTGILYAGLLSATLVGPHQFLLRHWHPVRRFGFVLLSTCVPIAAILAWQIEAADYHWWLLFVVAFALTAAALMVGEVIRRVLESSHGLRPALLGVINPPASEAYKTTGDERAIGMALSGGGYRASLFALGSLMYLHEACWIDSPVRRKVAAVASVSGGSVTNGLAAHALNIGRDDVKALDNMCKRLIRHTVATGSMFSGWHARGYYWGLLPITGLVFILFTWLCIANITWSTVWRGGLLTLLPFVVSRALVLSERVPRPKAAWADTIRDLVFFIAPLLAIPVVIFFALNAPTWRLAIGWMSATLLVATAAAAVWALRRPLIQDTFDTLLREGGRSPQLVDAGSDTHHIFCSTEVQFGETVFFARDQIRSRVFDRVGPGRLPTAVAVRASAAFPGAFPPLFLAGVAGKVEAGVRGRGQEEGFSTTHMSLVDGGVRDNLAIGWFEIAPDLSQIVVVSAAANRHTFKSVRRLIGLGEGLSLLNVINIPYNTRERNRRRAVTAQLLGKPWSATRQESAGVMVHIEDSPYDLAWKLKAKVSGASEAGTWLGMSCLPEWDIDQWLAVQHLWASASRHTSILGERAKAVLAHLDTVEARLPAPPPFTTTDLISLRVATERSPLGGDWSGGGSGAQSAWWKRVQVAFRGLARVRRGRAALYPTTAGWPMLCRRHRSSAIGT